MNTTCHSRLLVLVVAFLCAAFPLWAHPHASIVSHLTFCFDDDGLQAIRSQWELGPYTSADLVARHDKDKDGSLSEAECDQVARDLVKSLGAYDYFSVLRVNGKTVPVRRIESPEAVQKGHRVHYTFTIPCVVATADRQQEVRIAQYDASYYVAFEYATPAWDVSNPPEREWTVEKHEDREAAYYGATIYPEELVLRFGPASAPEDDGPALAAPGQHDEVIPKNQPPPPVAAPTAESRAAPRSGWRPRAYFRVMAWLGNAQKALQEQLEEVIVGHEEGRMSLSATLLLAFFAFGYGVLHAAGPGHGKVVTASYLVGGNRRYRSGIALGCLLALFHGLSGIAVVLLGRYALESAAMSAIGATERPLKIVSFSMVAALGAGLVAIELFHRFRPASGRPQREVLGENRHRSRENIFLLALAAGLVPCPGVVLVMLFSSGMGYTGLGIFLGLCVVLGMAVTISAIGLAVTAFRKGLVSSQRLSPDLLRTVDGILRLVGGAMVFAVGATLLLLTVGRT